MAESIEFQRGYVETSEGTRSETDDEFRERIKRTMAKPRAHRIEVDSCGECPFSHRHRDTKADPLECWHPYRDHAPDFRLHRAHGQPPASCPLRGAVTMIAVPKMEGDNG